MRLLLDCAVVKVRLDRKATSLSALVVLGIWRDGQKRLLAARSIGGESEAAWRAVLDDLVARRLRRLEFLIVDGAAGLEKALAALWPALLTQPCTVHKHRNLLAHAPEQLHDEVSADHTDMIYAATAQKVEAKRKALLRKRRLRCRAVADSLEEAGEALFAFTRLPPRQWKSARTTNAIERLHEEFRRRIKTETVLPSAETAAMLFWALLASGQITLRRVDGWQTIAQPIAEHAIDLAPDPIPSPPARGTASEFPPPSRQHLSQASGCPHIRFNANSTVWDMGGRDPGFSLQEPALPPITLYGGVVCLRSALS